MTISKKLIKTQKEFRQDHQEHHSRKVSIAELFDKYYEDSAKISPQDREMLEDLTLEQNELH